MESRLPEQFSALESFADSWGALHDAEARYLLRQTSSMAELHAYYDATAPRLDEIFDHLDRFPMDALPEPEALLYRIALGLTEAGQAIETFGEPGVPFSPRPHRMTIVWADDKDG